MLITFEGIEGSGKTTQLTFVKKYLQGEGHDCIVTREPGGTELGQKIRAILLDPSSKAMDSLTELLLYLADRAQHVNQIIHPMLAEGKIVLCDRFYDATVVYQGYARGVDIDIIKRLHRIVLAGFEPDLTILLDLDPKIGLQRAWKAINDGKRTGQESRFEKEALEFHEKVRAGYLDLARREPHRFAIVDAARNQKGVYAEIIRKLSGRISA